MVEPAPVGVADEAAVEVFVDVGRCLFGSGVDLRPDGVHVGHGARNVGMALSKLAIDAPAFSHRWRQCVEVANHHRRLVQMNAFQWEARHAFGQLGAAREQALAQRRHIERGQLGRVVRQIPGEQFVLVGGMARQRPHYGQAAALGREHARNVQKGPRALARGRQAQLGGNAVLLVQAEREVEQPGLPGADQPRQRDGGTHVRQRIVRGLVRQSVGARQVREPEARLAVIVGGPFDAVGAQRVGQPRHVEQIPAAAVVLPFARVGIDQVAPEHEARDLVVEADGVVAHADGASLREGPFDLRREFALGHAALQAQLRRDAGDQAGFGVGQEVGRRLAVQHQRLADLIEFGVGADARELRRAVAPHVGAKGFVVVPEEGVSGH